MDIFTGLSAQDVARATGTTSKQITDWCNQGLVLGQKGRLGKGHRREFSLNNLMEIAVAVALMQHGIRSPADAFAAAMGFAHVGSGPSGWVDKNGKIVEDPPLPERKPGFPYHFRHGETYLIVSGAQAKVIFVKKGQLDLYSMLPGLARPPAVFIAVNVSTVFAGVVENMGEDWRVVLDQVYGE